METFFFIHMYVRREKKNVRRRSGQGNCSNTCNYHTSTFRLNQYLHFQLTHLHLCQIITTTEQYTSEYIRNGEETLIINHLFLLRIDIVSDPFFCCHFSLTFHFFFLIEMKISKCE